MNKAPHETMRTSSHSLDPNLLNPQSVEVSVMAVYLALELTLRTAQAELDATGQPGAGTSSEERFIQELIRALHVTAATGVGRKFRQMAATGMPDALIPFKRPSLEVLYAASMMGSREGLVFKSADTLVDAGYFQADRNNLRYVDTAERGLMFRTELLPASQAPRLLHRLQGWARRPSLRAGHLDSDEFLRISTGLDGEVFWGGAAATANGDANWNMTLFRVASGRVVKRSFGKVALAAEGADLCLRKFPAERAMELQAASLDRGQADVSLWLHLAHTHEEVLAPLPDLLTPGHATHGWWWAREDIQRALGGSPTRGVGLPEHVAVELLRRFPWAWMPETHQWARMAHELNPHHA